MKIFKFILISLIFVEFYSCEDYLDLKPISQLTSANYYQTEDHMETAVAAMYNGMRGLFTNQKVLITEAPSDDISLFYDDYPEGQLGISQFTTTANNSVASNYWNKAYNTIYRCNIVIEKAKGAEYNSEDTKNRHIAEVKFIRALIYFDMIRLFGGVPLMTEILPIEDYYKIGRASKEEVWAQIKADLTEAAAVLPEPGYDGRATKYSALGILADVHLNLGEYSESKAAIDQVINSGKYQLQADFADVMKEKNNNGKHSIFAIQFLNQSGEGNYLPLNDGARDISISDWPYGEGGPGRHVTPSKQIWDLYDTADLRRDLTLRDSFTDVNGSVINDYYWIVKRGINNTPFSSTGECGLNHIVMRYAEALLISAEVENQLGNGARAVELINMIRSRAGLADFASTDQAAIHEEVYMQRRLELAFEQERWFDIIRSGKATEILTEFINYVGTPKYVFTDKNLLFPIPEIEIEKVGSDILSQNPGY